jgi:hypothetical protein
VKRNAILALGIAAVLAETAIWHVPVGGGDRVAGKIESAARAELDRLEMRQVTARIERRPLRRRLVLAGPADDFQRGELLRIMDNITGVSGVRWATRPAPARSAAR